MKAYPASARDLRAKFFEGRSYLFFNYIKSIATVDQQLTKIFNQNCPWVEFLWGNLTYKGTFSEQRTLIVMREAIFKKGPKQ